MRFGARRYLSYVCALWLFLVLSVAADAQGGSGSGSISYSDIKKGLVTLPYGTPFLITGSLNDVQIAGKAINSLMTVQTIYGHYQASDGVQGTIPPESLAGSPWAVTIGQLNAGTNATIDLLFTGTLSAAQVESIAGQLMADPAYQAAWSQFVTAAAGKDAAAQLNSMTLLAQTAEQLMESILRASGLAPKSPNDLQAALRAAIAANAGSLFNLNDRVRFLKTPSLGIADLLDLPPPDLANLSQQALYDRLKPLKGVDESNPPYSKITNASARAGAKAAVDLFLQNYENVVSAMGDSLKNVLFSGSSSAVVGSDTQTTSVDDLKKYAGFDMGALYSYRLNELRNFAMIHIYWGPVNLKTGGVTKSPGGWLRQRMSLAFGLALQDFSGGDQNKSKILGQDAFVYGLGLRLNKYFRLTAGGLLYRTSLPAVNGVPSSFTNSLRQEFFIGPSIDITALPALNGIFAAGKSN
jgi:hypothetical protein